MKVLTMGSGGREHAILDAISKSPMLEKSFVVPGNDGMRHLADIPNIDARNSIEVVQFCKKEGIEFVIIGSEEFLEIGISDALMEEEISVFGPPKYVAQLESSKSLGKDLAQRCGIPTPKWKSFSDINAAKNYIDKQKSSLVIKADGPAKGKGVFICHTKDEALDVAKSLLVDMKLGDSGSQIVIEEFCTGYEVSFFSLVDRNNVVVMGPARDYKGLLDNNKGPNTGGMGACFPASLPDSVSHSIVRDIVYPTVNAISINSPFRGVLFCGVMVTKNGPKLLEYNVRFGDPESQVMFPRLKSDLLRLMYLTAKGKLGNEMVEFDKKCSLCVVMASKGYPGSYETGSVIHGLDNLPTDVKVFHAGTKLNENNEYTSNGGRVLNIVSEGDTIEEARHKAYAAVDMIEWKDSIFRYDIGDQGS